MGGRIAAALFAWDRHAEASRLSKWLDKSHENAGRTLERIGEIGKHLGVIPGVYGVREDDVLSAAASLPSVLEGFRSQLASEWTSTERIGRALGLVSSFDKATVERAAQRVGEARTRVAVSITAAREKLSAVRKEATDPLVLADLEELDELLARVLSP